MSEQSVIILPQRPWARLSLISGLFGLFGPPLAVVVGVFYLSIFAIVGSELNFGDAWRSTWSSASQGSVLALYFAGVWAILPALACGAVVGWYEGWRGKVTAFSALMLGTACGALFYMIAEFFGWGSAVYGASFSVAVCIPVVVLLTAVIRFLPGAARLDVD